MGLSGAGGAGLLDPLLYPWDPPVASGVMDGDEFRPVELSVELEEALAQAGAAPLDARSLVVSIGSNSSADVMRRKFANYRQPVSAVLPLVRGQLHNIAVGPSAHVSTAGYIAAAPYPLMGECTAVWLSWLDHIQLMALDETEPNYRRIQLDGEACPLVMDHGERPEEFSLFTSRWGVLTDGGGTLPFLDQPALFGRLAGSGTGDLLAEGKSVFDGPPELVAEQLAMPSVRAWAREWFGSTGLAAPADFDGLCAGATPLERDLHRAAMFFALFSAMCCAMYSASRPTPDTMDEPCPVSHGNPTAYRPGCSVTPRWCRG
jgi:hypothetical protein